MIKIAPSILAADFGNLEEEIKLVDQAGCDYIHCDIMDGHFVPNISFGPEIVRTIRSVTKKNLDVHLMIDKVSQYINDFAKAGSNIISFHIEAEKEPLNIINKIKSLNNKVGLAIKPNTPLSSLENLIDHVDMILIMTVEPGFGGQKFMRNQINKIVEIKNLINKKSLNIDIEVDGGINNETGKLCVEAGANILVAGNYIFKETNDKYKDLINSLK
tara:strand:+ start:7745 stop:8392 length:648 start_codon:yes stop_codon:yes gene_type:complete